MKKRCIPLLVTFLAASLVSNANPVGEAVKAGSAAVKRNGRGLLTVNQMSDKVIIDWKSFSIGAGEMTRFVQPSASASALNRAPSGPGSLRDLWNASSQWPRARHQPRGILVGPSGVINTHSFIGSTMDVSDASFLSGVGMRFSGDSTASVRNEGSIKALGGDIFLFCAHGSECRFVAGGGGDCGYGRGQ